MTVTSAPAAHRLIGDHPSWRDLQQHHADGNALLRRAAVEAAVRAPDLPPPVRDVLVEVCLDHTGRATSWTQRFHRLRPSGNSTRYVAEVLQQASTDPVPHLVGLLARADRADLARACLHHPSTAVRTMARRIAGVEEAPSTTRSTTGVVQSW